MTRDADFKRIIRARMGATGEIYLQARTALMRTRSRAQAVGSDRDAPGCAGDVSLSSPPAAPARAAVEHFFDGSRLLRVPAKRSKRMVVLLTLVGLFEPGRSYAESEVREVLAAVHEDHAFLRRELVNVGYLRRESGVYTLAAAPPERDARWAHEFPPQERGVFAALWSRSA